MRIFAASLMFLVAACTGPTNGSDGADTLPLAGFQERYWATIIELDYCRAAWECDDQAALNEGRFSADRQTCEEDLPEALFTHGWMGEYAEQMEFSVAEGKIAYDPIAARLCLADLRARSLDGICGIENQYVGIPSCERALDGQLREGQGCVVQAECRGALSCLAEAPSSCVQSCGEYVVRPGSEGEPCADDFECQAALHCVGSECTPIRWSAEGERCSPSDPCRPGLACVSDMSGGAVCAPVVANGEPCLTDNHCGPLHACLADATSRRCARLVPGTDSCSDDEQCFSETCEDGACAQPDFICDAPEPG